MNSLTMKIRRKTANCGQICSTTDPTSPAAQIGKNHMDF